MKKFFFLFLLASICIGAAAAQGSENQTVANDIAKPLDGSTHIDEYSFQDGEVRILFDTEIPRTVTITDVGGLAEGNRVQPEPYNLQVGKNNVTHPVSGPEGQQVVSISMGDYIYPLEDRSEPILDQITRTDFYIFAMMTSVFTVLQTLGRGAWLRMRLKSGISWIA